MSIQVKLATTAVPNADAEKPLPMSVALIGIPGGLEVDHSCLARLVSSATVDFYEVRNGVVVLYWRMLPSNHTRLFEILTTAAAPGHFVGVASRAYLYYADEDKCWVDGLVVDVACQ